MHAFWLIIYCYKVEHNIISFKRHFIFSDNKNKEIILMIDISSAIELIYTRVFQADDGFNKMGHGVTIRNFHFKLKYYPMCMSDTLKCWTIINYLCIVLIGFLWISLIYFEHKHTLLNTLWISFNVANIRDIFLVLYLNGNLENVCYILINSYWLSSVAVHC